MLDDGTRAGALITARKFTAKMSVQAASSTRSIH